MPWDEVVRTLGSGGTRIAVSIAAYPLVLNRRQAKAYFEDDLSRDDRAISAELPHDGRPAAELSRCEGLAALLGRQATPGEQVSSDASSFLCRACAAGAEAWTGLVQA